jgi:hypothetical protein
MPGAVRVLTEKRYLAIVVAKKWAGHHNQKPTTVGRTQHLAVAAVFTGAPGLFMPHGVYA